MAARHETQSFLASLNARGIHLDFDHANELRRAQITLRRWAELECGDSNAHGSWAIERSDNGDGPPFMVHHHWTHGAGKDSVTKTRIPDREAGALRRVKAICEAASLYYYHQGDPRGCALYVAAEPMDDTNYSSRGVPCIGD